MGSLHMLAVNRKLNQTVSGIQNKFHCLEDLINGHRGVNDRNFSKVNTLISSISRNVFEMSQRVARLGHAEQVALLLPWANGRKYPLVAWDAYALMCVGQAKMFVNQY